MVKRSKVCSEGAAKVAAKAGKLHLCGVDRYALEFKDQTNDKECPQPTVQTSIIDVLHPKTMLLLLPWDLGYLDIFQANKHTVSPQ